MFARFRRSFIFLTVFLVSGLCASATAIAMPNATIVNGDAQLRQSYPSYSFSTLLKWKLNPGPILTIIPRESRVQVFRRRIVAKTQEWFEISYVRNNRTFTGWVYGGQVGNRRYIRLDAGVEQRISLLPAGPVPIYANSVLDAAGILAPSAAFAQGSEATPPDASEPQNNTSGGVTAPDIPTSPIRTLLVGLAHVVIFIGSLIATKKFIFPGSNTYSFLTGCCVLVILGVLSETTLQGIIGNFIAE